MKNIIITLVLTLCTIFILHAQETPVSAEIALNNIHATINSNGTLFKNLLDGSGQFLIEAEDGSLQTTMAESGLWLAGRNSDGELRGSFSTLNNFVPASGLNKIWRVTKSDIDQHRADFADNGIIDEPNVNIFAWPGLGNPHFNEYNQDLTGLPYNLAGYGQYEDVTNDQDHDYRPMQGDYPGVAVKGWFNHITPDEMLFMVFDDIINSTDQIEFRVQIRCTVFAYNCQEGSPINNTIFVQYGIINLGVHPMDNVYLGVANDFQIGNEEDDYFGTLPSESITYAYNGDAVDEDGFEETSPVMAFQMLQKLINIDGDVGVEVEAKYTKPIQGLGSFTRPEAYAILEGNNPDGTPDPQAGIMYPDNPNDASGDSEFSANNTPGNRHVISSYGPFKVKHSQVQEILAAYTVYQEPNNKALENVDLFLENQSTIIREFYESGFDKSKFCSMVNNNTVSAKSNILETNHIKVFPNPSSNIINLSTTDEEMESYLLVNLNGQIVRSEKWNQAKATYSMDVTDLDSGMYILKISTSNDKVQNEKVIVFDD